MKMTVFILLAACLQLSARSQAQTVTLSVKDVPAREVIRQIREQTGLNILVSEKALARAGNITLIVKDMPVNEALKQCFASGKFTSAIIDGTIVVKLKGEVMAPDASPPPDTAIMVHGYITNEKGEPFVGATILNKSARSGSASDADGGFLINVSNGDVITVSAVGYAGLSFEVVSAYPLLVKTMVTGQNTSSSHNKLLDPERAAVSTFRKEGDKLFIVLVPHVASLGDVVVTTAYGLEGRTKELGYSVAKITGKELNRTNPGNILTGLTGKVSGLVISNQGVGMDPDNNIMLRGIRSINPSANNQPLFVLNGSPLSFGSDQSAAALASEFINNLNPNDVEDITVLKGANGSALYGPEGVNGVIIINTKKGKDGVLNVNFKTSTTFQKIDWNKRKIQEKFGQGDLVDDNGDPIYNPTGDNLWGPAYNGEMVPLGRPDENGDVQMVPYKYTTDRQKFWNTARETRHNLSISQGDAHSDFYLGLNRTGQAGLMPGDEQTKTGILLNTGRRFKRWSVRLNVVYNNTNADKGPPNLSTDFIPPNVPLLSYKDYINNEWADRNHFYSDQFANPYETVANNRTKSGENALTGNMEFKIKPLPWLTVTERPGITFDAFYSKSTSKPLDYSDFAKELGANGRWISYQDIKAKVFEKTVDMLTINNDFLVSFAHQAGRFSIKATLGNTIRQSHIKDLRGGASKLTIPVYNVAFGELNEVFPSEKSQLARFYSFFGTALIGYRDMIFIELTGRNDWDSKLAVKARDKNFYSGINTSIVLSELFPSMQKVKWLNSARLRAAVTQTANMNIKPYQSNRLLEYHGLMGNQPVYGYMQNIPNPGIRPEHVLSQEYGGHFAFFNHKLDIDVAYYYQRNNGLILDVINSRYSGAPTTDNAGVYDNWGWEFDVNAHQLFKTPGGFTAGAGLRLAINDNKVVSLPPVYNGRLNAYAGSIAVIARTGHHAFEYALTDWQRDDQGHIIVDKNTGIPQLDYENPVFAGRTLPKYTASANLNLQWKGLGFSVLAEYRGGNEQFNESGAEGATFGRSLLTTYNNRVPFVIPNSVYDNGAGKYVTNTNVKISSIQDYYREVRWVSSNFLINAGFLTLREAALSYDLKLKSKVIKQVTVGAYARDLFSIYAKNNIYGDPELVKGPGTERDKGLIYGQGDNQSNFGSASANYDRLPGTIQYGFVLNVGF